MNLLQHAGPAGRVRPEEVELLVGQAVGLVEDVQGDHDLAEVVDQARLADHLDRGSVHAHQAGEEGGGPGDPAGVGRRVRVVAVDRLDELLEGRPRLGLVGADDAEALTDPGRGGGRRGPRDVYRTPSAWPLSLR